MMDIIIKDLSKSFEGKKVLDRFSAVFKDGALTSIMGPSGCGKTTLLNILMGLVPADSGSVTGVPAKIACVFQEDRLSDSYTALSNAAMSGASRALALEHLEKVGLFDDRMKKVSEMSGGMKRRVALVRAVLKDPELLILDEPFKGIDEKTLSSVSDYLKESIRGKTVILVTHDRKEADFFGGKIIEMKKL